jgi:hypothetical protein
MLTKKFISLASSYNQGLVEAMFCDTHLLAALHEDLSAKQYYL